MKITWVGPYKPVPGESGAELRSYYLMKNLKRQGFDLEGIFLASHGDECEQFFDSVKIVESSRWLNYLRTLVNRLQGLPLSYGRYRRPNLLSGCSESSLFYVDHLHMTANLFPAFKRPYWLDEHNLEYVLWSEYSRSRPGLIATMLGWEARRIKKYELEAISHSRGTGIPAEVQLNKLPDKLRKKTSVIPNGVPNNWLNDGEKRLNKVGDKLTTLGFIGSYKWRPNRTGMDKFLRLVWPDLKQKYDFLQLYLAGDSPPASWSDKPGVHCPGRVPSSAEFFANIDLLVVPLKVGSGTRLKILEAAARAVPVVGTVKAVSGLTGVDVKAVDSIDKLDRSIQEILDAGDSLAELREKNWSVVADEYCWTKIGKKLARVLQNCNY